MANVLSSKQIMLVRFRLPTWMMWKHCLFFQTTQVKYEKSLIFSMANLHNVPEFKKVALTATTKVPANIKTLLLGVTSLQILLNAKPKFCKNTSSTARSRDLKRHFLVSSLAVLQEQKTLFFQFLAHSVFPKYRGAKVTLAPKKKALDFGVTLSNSFKELGGLKESYPKSFELKLNIPVGAKEKSRQILFSLLKIPVKKGLRNRTVKYPA